VEDNSEEETDEEVQTEKYSTDSADGGASEERNEDGIEGAGEANNESIVVDSEEEIDEEVQTISNI
jgi:hypothetical protein